ncbi:hypothetical protein SAMN06265350_106134 [Solitalea koreensis]|uniref:Uncharacterized protein n=2 Tax=Solitalea koreensis TaxID=543615 RepID=A0A521DCC5_9SPHI|nr:hypothetical protein SAMN06265350_106134 [Solitalea koreensis]
MFAFIIGTSIWSCTKKSEEPVPISDIENLVSDKIWQTTKVNNANATWLSYIQFKKDSTIIWYVKGHDSITNATCFKMYKYNLQWLSKTSCKLEVLKDKFQTYEFSSLSTANVTLYIKELNGSTTKVEFKEATNVNPDTFAICSTNSGTPTP